MGVPEMAGGSGRPIDADLKFWGSVTRILTAPRTRMSEIRANVLFFIFVSLFCYLLWCVYDRFQGEFPSDVKRIVVETTPIAAGSELRLHIDLIRHRICERDFEWLVADSTGKRERFVEPHMHGIGNPGPDSFVQTFKVPADLAPGPAKIRLIWSWQCPENVYELMFSPRTLILPEVSFVILGKPQAPSGAP